MLVYIVFLWVINYKKKKKLQNMYKTKLSEGTYTGNTTQSGLVYFEFNTFTIIFANHVMQLLSIALAHAVNYIIKLYIL